MKTFKTFKFWKDNRTDQEYTLGVEELKEKYKEFLKTKTRDWIERYGHDTVNAFVGEKGGLRSVADEDAYRQLQNLLSDVRHELMAEKETN